MRRPVRPRHATLRHPALLSAVLTAAVGGLSLVAASGPEADRAGGEARGAETYRSACVTCHASDGRGASKSVMGYEAELPDFTDCEFASREPMADWVAVAHEGGPVRAFSRTMPAFGGLLSEEDLERAVVHIKSFCTDRRWPAGELNLPRPLITEKAFPEDEVVLTLSATTEDSDEIAGVVVYERRFGARNQWEIVVPYAWKEMGDPADLASDTSWGSGVGDVGLAVKRAFYHSLERGSIFSLTAEVILPTGDDEEGFGKGTTILEPFATWGQLLPGEMFFQLQAGLKLSTDEEKARDEAFFRSALGGTFIPGRFGRAWSPMVEILGSRELTSGGETGWDLVPQMQITLSRRQHVMINLGVRTPLTDREDRASSVIAYVLWDWFDGGFFQGWGAQDEH